MSCILRIIPLLTLLICCLLTVNADVDRSINWKWPIFNKVWAQQHFHEKGGYFEGDIIIDHWPPGYAGSSSPRWRDGLIPYTIHPNIRGPGRQAIMLAMQDIQSKTCITFKPRKSERDYVQITSHSQGCFSYVGRNGGPQQLNLGLGCWRKTTIIHELVHAVGFWHEQSRLDRDKYINIQWNNISPEFRREFRTHQRLNDFDTAYDLRSVMHYSWNAFARNHRYPTITTKKAFQLKLLGAGDEQGGLTKTDALQINRMYKCTQNDIPDKLSKINQ